MDDLERLITSRLQVWKKENQERLPNSIIIFRDGISESMYLRAKDEELGKITSACDKFYGENKQASPRLSFIVVGKRHAVSFYDCDAHSLFRANKAQTRFYPTSSAAVDEKSGSPPAGTCVDSEYT